jgi:hypothetical protein
MGIKYKLNANYFNNLNLDSAYLLGYLYADGNILTAPYMRGKYVKFTSIDKELITTAKRLLKSQHKIYKESPVNDRGQVRYILRIGSHKLFDSLCKIGLTPNKSQSMLFPALDANLLPAFIRGYFDGDGSVMIEYGRGSKNQKILKRMRVVFTSGSYNFLESLSNHLQATLNLKLPCLYKGNKSYQLSYSTSDSTKIFCYLYSDGSKLFLRRKYRIFKTFFLKYDKWQNDDIIKLLNLAMWRSS